jgi:hypothetical protein
LRSWMDPENVSGGNLSGHHFARSILAAGHWLLPREAVRPIRQC